MYTYRGRFCLLEELTTENDGELFLLMRENSREYRFLVSDESIPTTYELFQEKLRKWFSGGRTHQFLIREKNSQRIVGTIFFYCHNSLIQEIKSSAFFIPEIRKTLCVAESLAVSMLFAREIVGVDAVCFSVYAENEHMLKITKKLKAELMGISAGAVNPERRVSMYRLPLSVLTSITDKLRVFSR